MNISTFITVFGSGLVAGMIVLVIARKFSSGEDLDIFSGLKRLFSAISLSARQEANGKAEHEGAGVAQPATIDPREQNLYDSTQTVRNILLILTAHVQRTDKAASNSSLVLGDVKSAILALQPPTDLRDAHSSLLKEIDFVISSNSALKDELAKTHEVLTEQRRQIDALRTEVRIDGLTQLANRTAFDEKLNEMIVLHKRYSDPFSLLMVDLDYFKAINDTHGHPAGDRLLKGVAQKIKATLRGTDFLSRFGGDEYAIILIKTDIATATEVAWKLCEEVRGSRFLLDDAALTMTLSIGVAEANEMDTEETLLKRADAALYRAKAAGRNGVSIADPPK